MGNETLGQALGPDVPVSSCFTPSHRQTPWLRKPSLIVAHGAVGQCDGSELSQAWRILAVVHGQLSRLAGLGWPHMCLAAGQLLAGTATGVTGPRVCHPPAEQPGLLHTAAGLPSVTEGKREGPLGPRLVTGTALLQWRYNHQSKG